MAFRRPAPHPHDIDFGGRLARNRHLLRVEPRRMEGVVELCDPIPDDGGVNHIGLQLVDPLQDRRDMFLLELERHVDFIQNAPAFRAEQIRHDPVRLVGIDVIRPDQQDPFAEGLEQVIDQGHGVLIRRGPRVDAVARILEPLIKRGIEHQRILRLDHRQHRLARARHMPAEDHPHPVVTAQLMGQIAVERRRRGRIPKQRRKRFAPHPALGVDLRDCQFDRCDLRAFNPPRHTGFGHYNPDWPSVFGRHIHILIG